MPDHGLGQVSTRDTNFKQDGPEPLSPHAASVAVFEYDFAIEGGAVGTITLRGDPLPPHSLVCNGLFVPYTTPTSTSSDGTLALQIEAAGDLMGTSAAIDGTILDELVLLIPDWATVGDYKETTVPRSVKAVIATDALTAGKFRVYLWYVAEPAAMQLT